MEGKTIFSGLKENVIVGRLIPAGSGFEEYRDTFVISPKPEPVVVGATEPVALPREGAAAATGRRLGRHNAKRLP